jgi:hypothetical protein
MAYSKSATVKLALWQKSNPQIGVITKAKPSKYP